MAMFEDQVQPERKRWSASMLASLAVHLGLLGFLLYRAVPAFVTPSDVGLGIPHSYGSVSLTYLAPVGPEQALTTPEKPKLTLKAALKPKVAPPKPEVMPHEQPAATADNALAETARGGSLFGHVPGSPLTGDEVVPALPEVFPDPPVSREDFPAGVQGDVVVEVTIDPQGNVVETKLIQGMGYGVEQKVIAVLQRWHFRPATRDGVTIGSQHIVHFHYPS